MERVDVYALIIKYLNNESTPDEVLTVLDWCNQSEANKNEFIRIKKTWAISDEEKNNAMASSMPRVWNNIVAGIAKKTPKVYTKRSLIYYTMISSAAAVLLMLCLHVFTGGNIWQKDAECTHIYAQKGEKGYMSLSDGTKVWLNSGSELIIGNDFNAKNRTVHLVGEAFFDVAKSKAHKFVVKTELIDVVVHGTAFMVTAYPDADEVDVALRRGAVSVYRSGSNEKLASLIPNRQISIHKETFLTEINSFNDDSNIAWTFEELIFEYASLEEVFGKMENWYGVHIAVESPPARQDLKYRFKIKSESLTEILNHINKITPIEHTIDGKEVTIRYK